MQKTGYGSGTIVSDDGYVVTNYHVVKEGRFYLALLHDGSECRFVRFSDGRHYLHDEGTDLAVLKLESRGARFTPVTFGDSTRLREGESVIAVGNPYGLRHSVTSGIVSSLGRNDVGFAEIEDFIQTDVPINPGNSGGPLVNLKGEMVGVNTAIRTVSGGFQGISFAIPSDMVRKVFSELVAYGRVRRGWLGLLVKEEPAGGERRQIRVVSVLQNSPAIRAGIQPGDLILEADGEPLFSKGVCFPL
jgi:serine protease Do